MSHLNAGNSANQLTILAFEKRNQNKCKNDISDQHFTYICNEYPIFDQSNYMHVSLQCYQTNCL